MGSAVKKIQIPLVDHEDVSEKKSGSGILVFHNIPNIENVSDVLEKKTKNETHNNINKQLTSQIPPDNQKDEIEINKILKELESVSDVKNTSISASGNLGVAKKTTEEKIEQDIATVSSGFTSRQREESEDENVPIVLRTTNTHRFAPRPIKYLYYQVKEHNELYRIGTSYYKDIEAGIKHFGFISGSRTNGKQNLILGLAAYLNYHVNLSMIVFTSEFKKSAYEKYCFNYEESSLKIESVTYPLHIYKGNGIAVIEFKELLAATSDQEDVNIEKLIASIENIYDIVAWDLPDLEKMQQENYLFFPIIQNLDNISILVRPNVTRHKDICLMQEYFLKYFVKIKGLVVDNFNFMI